MIDPAIWTANAVLGDGETVSIRPITPADASRLGEFHLRQSPESIYRRYFSPKPQLSQRELRHFTEVDLVDRAALVVESHGELLGWASYERWPGRDDADTSFMVDDAHQGRGIATLLLEHLASIAKANGIERFTAEVLGENRPMLTVFARAGWPLQRRYASGVIEIDFPIAETPEFVDSVGRREQRADSTAMARMLLPRSIAVVGASDRSGSVGDVAWRNVTAAATVPVYAVNPNRRTIGASPGLGGAQATTGLGGAQASPVYACVVDVPADVSLAVIAVPAAALADTIADCVAARVRGAIVMTSIDNTDVDFDPIVEFARSNGMRIIGPSSMGVASAGLGGAQASPGLGGAQASPGLGGSQESTIEGFSIDASLLPTRLHPGSVAVAMQSGSLGASFLHLAHRLDVGLSWFVSLGDKSDVSGNDLLQFWEDDDSTRVIAMYNETLGNPRRFARIARRVSQRRPIVAVRTVAAGGPPSSALYQQCGLIEVPTVSALLDTVRVLATQPALGGDRIAVISNYPSPRMLAHAALWAAGLRTVEPPIQLDWKSSPDDYAMAITAALAADDVDGLLVIYAPGIASAVGEPIDQIDTAADGAAKPVTAVLLATPDGPIKKGSAVPNFMFPESAAAVLGRMWAYGRWLQTEAASTPVELAGIDVDQADELLAGALAAGSTQLDPATTAELLSTYGVSVPPTRYVLADDAIAAADEIGYPVAVKARHRRIGRSVRAGVALDLVDAGDVAESVRVMRSELGDDADYVVVQSMTTPGIDLRLHGVVDEEIGPTMSLGMGGIQADLVANDEPMRLAPLSPHAAEDLVAKSRVGEALAHAGIDGAPVIDTLLRAAQLAADHTAIAAIDLNPVITTDDGCCVTDAVVTITPVPRPVAPLRGL